MDDRQLIKEIAKDNDLAFGILIKKYEKLVFNTSYKLVRNIDDAEDICQDVFLKVYHCINQIRNEDDLSGWLFRIAYNLSISFLRKKNPAKANLLSGLDLNQDTTNTSFVDRNTPSHSLEQKEVAEELFRAIDNLPEMQKKAFLLHKFEDHSHKEICEILSITKASVESLIYRAKSNLRKSLLDYFNTNFI